MIPPDNRRGWIGGFPGGNSVSSRWDFEPTRAIKVNEGFKLPLAIYGAYVAGNRNPSSG